MIQAARNKLLNFSELTDPRFVSEWFHEIIAETLEGALTDMLAGKKVRIILSIPPRHGKTEIASKKFPAWALGKHPELKFILSTYGADLSEKIGLGTRDIINSEQYQTIFPGTILRPDVKAKAKWAIALTEGDKLNLPGGTYTAVGVGGAVTGTGANIIILDDVMKDRAEAESELQRDAAWEYYRSTLYSRLEGFGAVIVIMQRWHMDDLVGRLLEERDRLIAAKESYDDWQIINFPAIAEQDEYYKEKLVRKKGEPLWLSKFPLPVLENIRQVAGVVHWSSQFQQDPILSENQEFKKNLFKYYDEETLPAKYLTYHTVIDPAISQKKEADNTVILTIGKEVNGPNIYRIREDAAKLTPQQTVDLIFLHQATYNSSVHLETVAYQLALKYAILEQQKKSGRYFMVNEIKTTGNKEIRIRGLLPLYDAGVIFHKKSDVEYERELLSFPRGKHDDRIDSMSLAIGSLENTGGNFAKVRRNKIRGYFNRGKNVV